MKVVLADDHDLIRQGLRSLVDQIDGLKVIGEAENGRQVIRLVRKLKPDLVIMDVSMPELNGIDAARTISKEMPGTRLLALSMHADKHFILEMLKAGAGGYMLKNRAAQELPEALKSIREDHTYLSPQIVGTIVKDFVSANVDDQPTAFSTLTEREREVLQLLAEGKTTKAIAADLHLSTKTIETHRKHVMDKLQIDSIAGLTKYAIREGLTSLDR